MTIQLQNVKPYLNQDFEKIKVECLKAKKLFEDDQFPATAESIARFKKPDYKYAWKRPHEIFKDPQFIVDTIDSKDLDQGVLGNCWFIASVIALANNAEFMKLVVPPNQTFRREENEANGGYCGMFHFRFWQYGEWVDCVIDDRLPVDSKNKLIFCRNSRNKNELWCALLEKAYAKLASCYEFLDGGLTQDSMIDLTGGCEESFDLKDTTKSETDFIWGAMWKGFLFKSICSASIFSNGETDLREAIRKNGLVSGHAYSITKLIEIDENSQHYTKLAQFLLLKKNKNKKQKKDDNKKDDDDDNKNNHDDGSSGDSDLKLKVRLVRMRNPWGNQIEWNGRFSDKSDDWKMLDDDFKKEIGLVFDKEGEFWMPYEDFLTNVDNVTLVHVDMNGFSLQSSEKKFKWTCDNKKSAWLASKNAGGSKSDSFWTNPQFLIRLKDPDLDDLENKVSVIVSLMQIDSVQRRAANKGEYNEEPIQIRFYRVLRRYGIDSKLVNREKFEKQELELIGHTGPYVPFRTITKRFRVDEGYYVIIPSTYEKDKEVNFLLRTFTESEIEKKELVYDAKPSPWGNRTWFDFSKFCF